MWYLPHFHSLILVGITHHVVLFIFHSRAISTFMLKVKVQVKVTVSKALSMSRQDRKAERYRLIH